MMNHNLMWADWAALDYKTRIERAERDGWKLSHKAQKTVNQTGLVAPVILGKLQTAVEMIVGRKSTLDESKECCA